MPNAKRPIQTQPWILSFNLLKKEKKKKKKKTSLLLQIIFM